MSITARTYGNRKATVKVVDGEEVKEPNMASVTMSLEEAQAVASRDKTAVGQLIAAVKEAVAE